MNLIYQRWNENPRLIGEGFFTYKTGRGVEGISPQDLAKWNEKIISLSLPAQRDSQKRNAYPRQSIQARLLEMGISPEFPKVKYIQLPPYLYQEALESWRQELRIAINWLQVEDRLFRDIEATREFSKSRKRIGRIIQVDFQPQDLDLALEA